jgi:hypothetical protein
VVLLVEIDERGILSSLLYKISSNSDTATQHKDLDYKPFLDIQLELIQRIEFAEREIQRLRKEESDNVKDIEKVKEFRKKLKFLGTTIAWVLLEFDRHYIRCFGRGRDSGFLLGKKGLETEIKALKLVYGLEKTAGILHDITDCLHIGDLTTVSPRGRATVEVKSTVRKEKSKLNRRGIRQMRRGAIADEFYYNEISTKWLPNKESRRFRTNKREKYNWNEASEVIEEAIEKGQSVKLVEECMLYSAFAENKLSDAFTASIVHLFKNPQLIFGCHDHQIKGIPFAPIMPFTCFDLPAYQKEKLLFNDINFCVFLDLNSLVQIFEKSGIQCKISKNSKCGILKVSGIKGNNAGIVGYPMTNRLIYECLSVETLIDFILCISHKKL